MLDQEISMVDAAHHYMGFCHSESCGKCIPCRAGTVQLQELLNRIRLGQGALADLGQQEEWSDLVKSASLCSLGQTAPNPILSTLRSFPRIIWI